MQGKVYADRTLRHWIRQGVLLLNTSLTTRVHMPNSHKHIWQGFTEKVIRWLDKSQAPIWVLWGNEAKNYRRIISSQAIVDAHPSPLSFKYRRQHTFQELARLTDITW
ncbi:uracil-DNA glycosylase family protein [Mycoplasma sp. ATU-Cv-508]|uniref:uracil-DNA glycosylase family protein n=1 Tax=Mycoplasma sp. ATU-Cv-508 TaxID=2048001 RepID=UPI000FDD29F0